MERIQGLTIDLALDSTAMNRGLKNLKSRMRDLTSELKANMSVFDSADNSIERHEARLEGLGRKLELQRRITREARAEYERISQQYGENSKQAQKAARELNEQVAAYNNLERYVNNARIELEDLREEVRISESVWGRLGSAIESAGSSLTELGDRMKTVGQNMTAYVTAPLAGLGVGLAKISTDFDSSSVKIQNSLDLTKKEVKELTETSRNIFKAGFGESVEEIDYALIQTRQNIRGLNNEDLEKVTKNAIVLADTFEADVNEVTRAANTLIQNYGMTAEEAFDIIAKGAKNGMNFSNEMFDKLIVTSYRNVC